MKLLGYNEHPFIATIDYGPNDEVHVDIIFQKTPVQTVEISVGPLTARTKTWEGKAVKVEDARNVFAQAISGPIDRRIDSGRGTWLAIAYWEHGDAALALSAGRAPVAIDDGLLRELLVKLRDHFEAKGEYEVFDSNVDMEGYGSTTIAIGLSGISYPYAALDLPPMVEGTWNFTGPIQVMKR